MLFQRFDQVSGTLGWRGWGSGLDCLENAIPTEMFPLSASSIQHSVAEQVNNISRHKRHLACPVGGIGNDADGQTDVITRGDLLDAIVLVSAENGRQVSGVDQHQFVRLGIEHAPGRE
jgi:hypothetical protein